MRAPKFKKRKSQNIAQGGNILADVKLYESRIRFDDDVFTRLYGSTYTRIYFLKIEKPINCLKLTLILEPVLQISNMHSTVIAHKWTTEELAPVESSY